MSNCLKSLYDYDMVKKVVFVKIFFENPISNKIKRKKMAIDLSVYLVVKNVIWIFLFN